MISRCVFRAVGGLILWGGALSPARAEADRGELVKDVLDRLVIRNEGHGGGVVRIANTQGVLVEDAAGLMAGQGSRPMEIVTPFEVASITKAVTAATVLKLSERGTLKLDDRLGKVLPGQEGFDKEITIRQLLSHTSGLPDYWTDGPKDEAWNNEFVSAFMADPEQLWSPEAILALAREIPAKQRGGNFHYSDTNYVLLGLIIERVAGQPLHRVFRKEIFDPLGMNDTWLTYKEERRGAEPSHRYEGNEDMHNQPRQSADWAGGGLMSTTKDLEKFLRGLASGRLFRNEATLDVMREAVPVGEEDLFYGLGLYRVKLGAGRGELWGHDGHGNSFAYYWPEQDITFTGTLNQTDNDWWPLAEAFINGGDPQQLVEEADKSYEVSLSTGWDSLFMDRGVNGLHDGGGYGSGIYWIDLDITWGITDVDYLTVNAWQCFATQGAAYNELDTSLAYTRLVGNFALSLQYLFTHGYADGNFYANDLTAEIAYEWTFGPVKLTPAMSYCLALGPDADDGSGFVQQGAGYLMFRLDGHIPVYRDVVALEPWSAFGVNFKYNTRDIGDEETEAFTGANNLELGLAVPVKINRYLTVAGFAAYSRELTNLSNTEPNTFWAGASLIFTY